MDVQHSYGSLTDLRLALHRNGYLPVPITAPSVRDPSAGKKPLMEQWQTVCAQADEEMVRRWSHEWRRCTNTGILTNRCRAGDIDVHDADLAQRLLALAFEHFGSSPLLRTGEAPKILGVWAGSDEFPKASTKAFILPNGTTARVEILAVGQQFVAYGDHPVTNLPYYWHGDTPVDVPVCELETISFDAAKTFCAAAEEMIVQAGGVLKKSPKKTKTINSRTEAAKSNTVIPLSLSNDVEKWATAALNSEYDNVTHAVKGSRNDTLNIAAFNLGQIVGAGYLSANKVSDFLAEAGKVAGLPDYRIFPTIKSGLTAGMARPRDPKIRDVARKDNVVRPTEQQVAAPAVAPICSGDSREPTDIFRDSDLTGIPVMPAGCLPNLIEEFSRDVAERLGCDPIMVAAGSVVACAAAIDDKWKIQPKRHDTEWKESARLWLAIIADPSAKKTPAVDAVKAPLKELDDEFAEADEETHRAYELDVEIWKGKKKEYTNGRISGEIGPNVPSPAEPNRPPRRRLVVDNVNIPKLEDVLADNPAGVCCVKDELATLFASFQSRETGEGEKAAWLSAYNGGGRTVDRIKRGTIRIKNYSACLIGGIQPDLMRHHFSKASDDGFIQRFMLVHAHDAVDDVDRPPNVAALEAYDKLVRTLHQLKPAENQSPFQLSDEAQTERQMLKDAIKVYTLQPDATGLFKSHMGKWGGLFARLLLTFHMVEAAANGEVPNAFVSGETAKRVVRFMLELLHPNIIKFYRDLAGVAPHVEAARWIAGYILSSGKDKVTHRDIYRSYSSALMKQRPTLIAEAMRVLDLASWVDAVEPRNGRETTEWLVNPLVHTVFAKRAAEEKARRDAIKAQIAREAKRLRLSNLQAA